MIDQTSQHGGNQHGGDEKGREPWDDAAQAAPEDHAAAFGSAAHDHEAHDHVHDRLALGEDERLPWLDSADDVDHQSQDSGRMAGFVALGLLALAALIGGLYWVSHSQSPSSQADGSLIEASKAPYKVEPANPGGKTFEGTGDSSYKVSEGKRPDGSSGAANAGAKAADAKAAAEAKPGAGKTAEGKTAEDKAAAAKTAEAKTAEAKTVESKSAAAKPAAAGAASQGGVGVQVGAFSSHAAAEAAWSKLSAQYSALSGHSHRIVEGKADIGTVYRLQALANDAGAASALCGTLQSAGLHCQVKP